MRYIVRVDVVVVVVSGSGCRSGGQAVVLVSGGRNSSSSQTDKTVDWFFSVFGVAVGVGQSNRVCRGSPPDLSPVLRVFVAAAQRRIPQAAAAAAAAVVVVVGRTRRRRTESTALEGTDKQTLQRPGSVGAAEELRTLSI